MDLNSPSAGYPSADTQNTGLFNNAAGYTKPAEDIGAIIRRIDDDISRLAEAISVSASGQNADDLRAQIAKLRQIGSRIDKNRYALHVEVDPKTRNEIDIWMNGLSHESNPAIGQTIAAWEKGLGAHFVTATNSGAPVAEYAPYNLAKGFINEISVNAARLGSEDAVVYYDSRNHEMAHAGQIRAAPFLHLSPWNKNTNIFLHPESWLRAITMTERHAYAYQTFMNHLLAQSRPELRDRILAHTQTSLVPLQEFEDILAHTQTMQDALIETSVRSLERHTRRQLSHGRTYGDNYHDSAMADYWNGFVLRAGEPYRLVTLSHENLFMIGDHPAIPNTLGKGGTLDPRFLNGLKARSLNARGDIEELCRYNNLPSEENCLAYDDLLKTQEAEKVYTHSASSSFAAPLAAAPIY